MIDDVIIKLKVNPKNPRTIKDKALNKLKAKIETFPQMLAKRPIVYDSKNDFIILGGNRRYDALMALVKEEKIEIKEEYFADAADWTAAQKRKFIVIDNISDGEWDYDKLANQYEAPELIEWGLDLPKGFGEEDTEEDDVPALGSGEAVSQLGEVYQLGRHRLMCGDSTKIEDVERLMKGQKADMVFTDPPYGMKKESEGVLNDNLNYDDLLEFNKQWIPLTFDNLKDNGSWYCWGIDEPLMDIYSNILKPMRKDNKITFRNLITWDKGNGQGQLASDFRMYPIADEKCLFVMCGVQGFNNNADNYFEGWTPIVEYLEKQRQIMGWTIKDTKRIAGHSEKSGCHWFDKSQWMMPTEETYRKWQSAAKGDAFKKEYDELKKEYYATRAWFDNTHDNMNNVWHFSKTSGEEKESAGGHATPKPIALCSRAIKSSSREEETVLDVFGGSGSTLIACEELGRKCYCMEFDPKYCDVIRKRYWKFINKGEDNDWELNTPVI